MAGHIRKREKERVNIDHTTSPKYRVEAEGGDDVEEVRRSRHTPHRGLVLIQPVLSSPTHFRTPLSLLPLLLGFLSMAAIAAAATAAAADPCGREGLQPRHQGIETPILPESAVSLVVVGE